MPAPTASAIYTPKNGIDYVGNQKECFDGVAEKLNAGIQSVNVVDVMKKHAEEGNTVFFSSHILKHAAPTMPPARLPRPQACRSQTFPPTRKNPFRAM